MVTYAKLLATFALLGVLLAALVVAGPLNPLAGPVTGMYKTLSEVEPRIAIDATNTPGDADSVFRIPQHGSYYFTGNVMGVAGWASGVGLQNATSGTVRGVTASACTSGISVGTSSIAESCVSTDNAGSGFTAIEGVTSRDCVASLNGIDGISCSSLACMVEGGTALNSGRHSMSFAGRATVVSSTSVGNGGTGIIAGSGSVITSCVVSNNDVGISCGDSRTVANNSIRQNTTDGVTVADGRTVFGTTCDDNGAGISDGAGICVTGGDNRIEGNNCTDADRGIELHVTGNMVIRNTRSDNTINWTIAAGNHYGPLIDRTVVAAQPAVNSNAAVETLGFIHSNANFTY